MKLEDYFEFEKFDTKFGEVERIRVKGTRIPIEIVIRDYLGGCTPEQIVASYRRSLNLEEVFATLTYYYHNRATVDAYMQRGEQVGEAYYQEYLQQEKPEVVKRLMAIRAQRQQQGSSSS